VHFERFLALAPQELSAYLYLSQTLLALHRPGDAREILERGSPIARQAEQNPLNATTITRLGEVWEQVNAALKGEVTPPSKP
jgi:hypothetical protein